MEATGYVDDATLYELRVALPEADRVADVDVAYDVALAAADLTIWRADGGGDEGSVNACSDAESPLRGTRVSVVSGEVHVEAAWASTAENGCGGTDHVYDATITLTDVVLDDGPVEVAPFTVSIGWLPCGG